MKIFVSYVSTRQWLTLAEKYFNNQVDGMTTSVDPTQPLSPAILVITQWTHEQSDHDARDGGYSGAQQHELPLTKAELAMNTAECPICSSRAQH